MGEAARIVQAALAGARDSAIKANAPRGVRFLPDLTLSDMGPGPLPNGRLAANRVVPIEPAPDLTDSSPTGSATFVNRFAFGWSNAGGSPPAFPFPPGTGGGGVYPFFPPPAPPAVLIVAQALNDGNDRVNGFPKPPTNWFWNVRVGDRFRFNDSGRYYTVVGPMTVSGAANPENFVNDGATDVSPFAAPFPSLAVQYGVPGPSNPPVTPEYLFLVNGVDDDGDGFADNGLDGVDVNPPAPPGSAVAAPNGAVDDIGEWVETEAWLGAQVGNHSAAQGASFPGTFRWTIARQPVVSPGAREVTLPGGAVVDLTTWDSTGERSRPGQRVNRSNGTFDVLLNQAGQVVPRTPYSSPSSSGMGEAFYHFWVAARDDVATPNAAASPHLPVSPDAANLPNPPPAIFLKKGRVLVTLFARTGQVVVNSIEAFDTLDADRPYGDAQLGVREAR